MDFTKSSQIVEKFFCQKFHHEFCDIHHCFYKLICYLQNNDSYMATVVHVFSCYSFCGELKKEICVT